MDILINVSKQRLKLATNLKKYVSGSQEFVRFVFGLNSYWRDLLTFAQFAQNGNTYNRYLDDENAVYLPSEIVAGECTLTLFGSGNNVIATTNYLTLTIDENILVSDASSTDISESLYEQLVDMVRSVSNGTAVVDTTSKMTDKNKIYVYIGSETGMTNGNWYYWNGTVWTSGGVWNAVAVETDKTLSVEDKAADGKAAGSLVEVGSTQPTSSANKIWIDPTDEEIEIPEMSDLNAVDAKVDDLKSDLSAITEVKYGKNRFDINAPLTQGYYNSSGEIVGTTGTWLTSDYCYVKGFEQITCSGLASDGVTRNYATMFFLASFNDNKEFIELIGNMPSNPVTLDSDVAYVRFSFNHQPQESEKYMLEECSTITNFEPYRAVTVLKTDDTLTDAELPANSKAVGDALKNIKDVREFEAVELDLIRGKLMNGTTGNIADYPNQQSWIITDYVDIEDCGKVMVTTDHFYGYALCCFFDKDKSFIKGYNSESGSSVTYWWNNIIDVPSNAKYIVLGYLEQDNIDPFLFKGIKQNAIPSQIWGGKKWTVIGDSLTANNSRTSMHYFDYIKGFTGIDVVNLGSSGTGYATTNPFYDRVDDVPLDSDVVTIFGSFNDLSTSTPLGTKTDSGTSTIGGCINKAIDDLFTAFPLANLGIITPTPWAGQNEHDGDTQGIAYVQLIKDICYLRGIPCLDLFHESGLRPWDATFRTLAYSKDDGGGTHPDEVGHKIIAPKVEAFLDSLLMH